MKKFSLLLLSLLVVGMVAAGVQAIGGGKGLLKDNEAAKEALENEDYDAFIDAIDDDEREARIAENLDEDRFNQMVERHNIHEQVKQALEDEDYDAWVDAIEDTPMGEKLLEVINEDNFDRLVDLHEAKEAGDRETAKEIAEELGLPVKGGCHGKGHVQKFGGQDGENDGQRGFGPRNFGGF